MMTWLKASLKTTRTLLLGASVVVTLALPNLAQAADHAVLLMYHRFGEDKYPATNIKLDQFKAHLEELKTGGYTVLPLEKIIDTFQAGQPLPDKTIAITMDDAFRSIYTNAWPLLKEYGYPFTIFVSTDPLDKNLPDYMTWDMLREMSNSGVGIGNHTADHVHLPTLSQSQQASQVAKAQARISQELGQAPSLFAFPYGEANTHSLELVQSSGFKASFGQHSGAASAHENRFYIPRYSLNERFGNLSRFKMLAKTIPLHVQDVFPATPTLDDDNNPPLLGFTLRKPIKNLKGNLNCYASNMDKAAKLHWLGETRIEVRIDKAFTSERGRINCTAWAGEGRWYWFGMLYTITQD